MAVIGRALKKRNHRVTVFQLPDLQTRIEKEGLDFVAIQKPGYRIGELSEALARLGQMSGLKAFRATFQSARALSELIFNEGPTIVKNAKIDLLLIDQNEPTAAALAEFLKIPFISVSNALPINAEPDVPPSIVPWIYHPSILSRWRNRIGYQIMTLAIAPLQRLLNQHRKRWNLPPAPSPDDTFSRLAEICQMPKAFDFPRTRLPAWFHYTGPLRDDQGSAIEFPWDRLDGRPLIFASLGTLQTGKAWILQMIAKACEELPYQLVLCHAGALTREEVLRLPGRPVAVAFGPQRKLLAKAQLTITHAGLNTTLDSLNYGVPIVAIPITFEQPGIAARIQWTGTGTILEVKNLTADTIQAAILDVMGHSHFKEAAERLAKSINASGGVERAADIVEHVLRTGLPCLST